MGRTFASLMTVLCLTGGLANPSQSFADGDDPDTGDAPRVLRCPMESARKAQLYPFQVEPVPPNQIGDLGLSLWEAEGWKNSAVNKYGTIEQERPTGRGSFAFVSLQVLTAKDPEVLRDAFDDDHRHALTGADDPATERVTTIDSDSEESYEGCPSWFVRSRTELPFGEILCEQSERSARDVLIERGGKTYLAQIWGAYNWDYALSEADGPDLALAEEVAEQAANGLAVDTG